MALGDGAMIDQTEADTHIQRMALSTERLAWDAFSVADKETQLRAGQAIIDAGMWTGVVAASDQLYSWPRRRDDPDVDPEAESNTSFIGINLDPTTSIPLLMREALALLAWNMTDHVEAWARAHAQTAGIVAQGVTGISESYAARQAGQLLSAKHLLGVSHLVWHRVQPFWRTAGRII